MAYLNTLLGFLRRASCAGRVFQKIGCGCGSLLGFRVCSRVPVVPLVKLCSRSWAAKHEGVGLGSTVVKGHLLNIRIAVPPKALPHETQISAKPVWHQKRSEFSLTAPSIAISAQGHASGKCPLSPWVPMVEVPGPLWAVRSPCVPRSPGHFASSFGIASCRSKMYPPPSIEPSMGILVI